MVQPHHLGFLSFADVLESFSLFLTFLTCDGRATSSVSVSSREENCVQLIPCAGPSVFLFIIQYMTRLNKTADITQPCITPHFTYNKCDI